MAYFFNAMCISVQAPFYPHEAELKGATTTQYSFVFSVFELTVFLVGNLFGQLVNKIGVKYMNNAGSFTVSMCCIIFGFLNRINGTAIFLSFSFLIRIVEAMGNSAFMTSAFSIIAQEFPLNVGFAFAIVETFFGIGLIAGPAVGGALYELGGFTLPFITLGLLLCTASVSVWYFLPEEEIGNRSTTEKSSVFVLLKRPRIFLAACTTAAASISVSFLQATLEPHIRPMNLTPLQIGLVFVSNGLTHAIAGPICGYSCDKGFPERAASTIGALIVVVSFLMIGPCPLLPIENSLPLCIAALSIHGLGFGVELVATFSGAQKEAIISGLPDDISTYGLVSGLWTTSFALGAFVGPSIAGVLFDTVGFAWGATLVACLHLLVAVITMFCCFFCKTKPIMHDSESIYILADSKELH